MSARPRGIEEFARIFRRLMAEGVTVRASPKCPRCGRDVWELVERGHRCAGCGLVLDDASWERLLRQAAQ